MAQGSGGNTITQRIALDGGKEIQDQLTALGATAEKVFKDISDAAQVPNSHLSQVSGVMATLRNAAKATGDSFKPLGESFKNLGESLGHFKESMVNLGEQVFPHFKEVAAVAVGASIAGFVELAKSSAQAAEEIKRNSELTGLSTLNYQALSNAAAKAGISQDEFTQAMTRLNRSLGESLIQAKTTTINVAQEIAQGVSAAGVTVLNSHAKVTSKLVGDIQATFKAIEPAAQRVFELEKEAAGKFPGVVPQSLTSIRQLLVENSQASEAFRKSLVGLGVVLPPKTLVEALERMRDAGSDLNLRIQQLGVKTQELGANGLQLRPLEAILVDLSKAFEAIPNKAEAAQQAQALFQRSGLRMLKVLQQIREGTANLAEEFVRMNVPLDAFALEVGAKLHAAFVDMETALSNVKNLFILAFSPVLTPLLEAITAAVTSNASAIVEWARGIATSAVPVVEDLIKLLEGFGKADLKTDFAKNLVDTVQALKDVATGAAAAFGVLVQAMDAVAAVINSIFGTEITGKALAIGAVVFTLAGGFTTLAAIIGVVAAAASVFVAAFTTIPGLVITNIVLLAALIAENWGRITDGYNAVMKGITDASATFLAFWTEKWTLITTGFSKITDDLLADWNGFVGGITAGVNTALGALSWLGNKIASLASDLASLFAGAGSGDVSVAGKAGGGAVRGRGTGTSDSIPIMASHGEWVMRAAAVRKYGTGFMHAVNVGQLPRFDLGGFASAFQGLRPSMRFAGGGMVPQVTGGGSPVHLHIGSEEFVLHGQPGTVADLASAAKASQLRRTGRMPGWRGG